MDHHTTDNPQLITIVRIFNLMMGKWQHSVETQPWISNLDPFWGWHGMVQCPLPCWVVAVSPRPEGSPWPLCSALCHWAEMLGEDRWVQCTLTWDVFNFHWVHQDIVCSLVEVHLLMCKYLSLFKTFWVLWMATEVFVGTTHTVPPHPPSMSFPHSGGSISSPS